MLTVSDRTPDARISLRVPGGWGVYTGGFVPREGGAHAVEVQCVETGRKASSTLTAQRGRNLCEVGTCRRPPA